MKERMIVKFVGVLVFAVLWSGSAYADNPTTKLGRGLANTFLGFFEIPNQVINTYREHAGRTIVSRNSATVQAISVGTVRGVREAFVRTGHGIWDTATFLSPGPGGNNYKSRVSPEFITEDYNY